MDKREGDEVSTGGIKYGDFREYIQQKLTPEFDRQQLWLKVEMDSSAHTRNSNPGAYEIRVW